MIRIAVLLLVVVGVAACSSLPEPVQRQARGPNIGEVLADLPELALEEAEPVKPSRADVMAAYNRVYGRLESPVENHAIGKRLADLEMAVGEDRDIEGLANPYDTAIDRYEGLLDAPEGVPLDQILYQLARAYDISGAGARSLKMLDRLIFEYPESVYIPEARFRRAEMHFSANRYEDAGADYQYVVALGDETPYLKNARYMLGWSEFKQSNLEEGLTAFFAVVDDVLASEEALPQAEQELLDDSFRAIVLALQYLEGAETLAVRMQALERPHWQHLAYDKLAADYHEKERFLDTVRTWEMFVSENGLDPMAPSAQERIVQTLIEADFPSQVPEKKRQFVEQFGLYSEFYAVHDESVRDGYTETLHTYLVDLAKAQHAEAQELAAEDKPSGPSYLAAAGWYEELLETFPEHEAVAERLFLLGEVYTEADEPMRAVAAYQRVVREYVEFEQSHEAGYAAVLGLGKALERAPENEREIMRMLQIDAQLEFALLFPGDERAPAVQAAAADSLFTLERFSEAVDVAENLLINWPDTDVAVRTSALLIVGHGHFELLEFAAAETAYRSLLEPALAAGDEVTSAVTERLLATIYKQGELAEADEDSEAAVHHYLRLSEVNPASELAVRGHFDAVAVVEADGDVPEAARLLEALRANYPDHELSQDVGLRLASLYEGSEEWALAARELSKLADTEPDEAVRRQSRYRAAELYLKVEDVPAAIAQFESYVATFEEPADVRFEAMQHLDDLSVRAGDAVRVAHWKQQKITLERKLGKQATERMTFVAAHDSFFFAQEEARRFEAIELSHPLKKSLRKKQKALKETVAAFERVAEYQVGDLGSAATYHIADLYRQLGGAIMASDRPGGLSEMELEQYEILLEEQAYPFEEQAISLHEINMRRSWEGVYDDWVKQSFEALRQLMPARFDKQEVEIAYVEVIH